MRLFWWRRSPRTSRPDEHTLKFYFYISDAKVDMLYRQIPQPLLKSIAAELNINITVLGTGVGTTLKPNQPEETRYSRLKVVQSYIEHHFDVGTVEAPRTYFKGALPMRWGPISAPSSPSETKWVFLAGSTGQTTLGLAGSRGHLIGNNEGAAGFPDRGSMYGNTAAIVNDLRPLLASHLTSQPLQAPDSIEFLDGPLARTTVELTRPRFTLGSDPTNDISIDHPAVSERHAALLQGGPTGWMIERLDPKNPVSINWQEMNQARPDALHNRDRVTLGTPSQGITFLYREGAKTLEDQLKTIYSAVSNFDGPAQNVEFLAVKLLEGTINPGGEEYSFLPPQHIVFGTPIYVALAE